jgi:hypothetical protein
MIRARAMDERCDAAVALCKIVRNSNQFMPAETGLEAAAVSLDEISS